MEREDTEAEAIVERLPIGIVLVDRELRIRDLNAAAEAITGYAPPQVRGEGLAELLEPELWGEESALARTVGSGERTEPQMTTVTTQAGPRQGQDEQRLLVGAAPAPGGYVLTLQEAGPFHSVEADRVSDLSHDLRGPLASIRAYTELLVDGVDEGDPDLRRQFLDVIDGRTRRLTDLVVNLTALIRWHLGALKLVKSSVSLRETAGEVVAGREDQARQQGVRLALDAQEGQHQMVADRDALSIVLNNLVDNAIKFSGEGQDVVVTLRSRGHRQVVMVRDSGSGIPTEDLPHIFDPFYRGSNAVEQGVEGSGLGLTLVQTLAEAHGWEIDVASEENEGTSVRITMAIEPDAPRPS